MAASSYFKDDCDISDPEDSLQGPPLSLDDCLKNRRKVYPYPTAQQLKPSLGTTQPKNAYAQMTSPLRKPPKCVTMASSEREECLDHGKNRNTVTDHHESRRRLFKHKPGWSNSTSPSQNKNDKNHSNNRKKDVPPTISEYLEKTEHELFNVKQERDRLKLEMKQLELQHNDNLIEQNQAFQRVAQDLIAETQKEQNEKADLQERYERKITELETNYRDLAENQERRIRGAQDAAKILMHEATQRIVSDDEIESHFKSKSTFWYNWAKDTAKISKDWGSKLSPDERSCLFEQTRHILPPESQEFPPEFLKSKSGPALLVQALVSDFMCHRIVSRPLWVIDATTAWLDKNPDDPRGPQLRGVGLFGRYSQSALALFQRIYPKESTKWQAEINENVSMPISPTVVLTALFCEAAQHYADLLTSEFVEGPSRVLLKVVSERRSNWRSTLVQDVKDSLEFSARTWDLKSSLCVYDMTVFKAMHFQHSHQLMTLHHSQSLDGVDFYSEDDDNEHEACDESLFNGLPIGLLVQPAIVALGNETGGSHASILRILSRGTVWIEGTGPRKAEMRRHLEFERTRRKQLAEERKSQESIWGMHAKNM